MPDYSKGKIYKLWSPQGEEIYIGSTTETLARRKSGHKCLDCSSKILFEKYDDVRIELIEEYPCKNKMELNKREGHHIRNNNCVNKITPCRTTKEWREDNKERFQNNQKKYNDANKEKYKEYYEDNKEEILKKMRQKITCECGSEISMGHLTRHKKISKKHINFIQQQQASEQ
jgi:adenylate kinase family enzyme